MTRVVSDIAIRTTGGRKEEQPVNTSYMKSAGKKEGLSNGLAFIETTEIVLGRYLNAPGSI